MARRIGVDVGGSKIEAILLAADGTTLARRRVSTPGGDYRATLAAIRHLVAELDAVGNDDDADETTVAGIGVGIPGVVSPATGLVKNANATWLNGRPLDRDLAALLGRPVRVANDANCFAVSEATDGAAAGAASVFGVILGTGVGGGIVIDGRPITGANAIAGEWGHNPLPWPTDAERPGPACYCGRSGCTETFLSGPGLVRDYRAAAAPAEGWPADGEPATAAAVAARADGGDRAALAALDRYAERLARSLAAVVNLLDPEVIVLGGGLSNLDVLYARVPALWQRWIFSDRVATRLVRHRHGDSSGVRGAAWLWPAAPGAAEHRW